MLYTTITIGGNDYKARLTTKSVIDLERKLGTNPVNVLVAMGAHENELPNLEILLNFLHASLQAYEHGMSVEKVYDLYDEWIEEGHTLVDLINIIVKVFQDSGLIPNEDEIAKNAKKGK